MRPLSSPPFPDPRPEDPQAFAPGPDRMPAVPISRKLIRWSVVLLIATIAANLALPKLRAGDNAIPLIRLGVGAAQQYGPSAVFWAGWGAAALLVLGILVWSASWTQWRRSRVHGSIARFLKIRSELLRVRARWSRGRWWIPAQVRVRYPSGMVDADPSDGIAQIFLVQFGITADVAWYPQRDGIEITRVPPRLAPPVSPRLEDEHEEIGKLHTTLAPLLPGLTVDQGESRLDDNGNPALLILTYDQTTKDIATRFKARVQAVLEEKVPSPTGAWAIKWRPEQHRVEVRPSEPLPRYARNEGLPKGWTDRLAIPLGVGSGGRILAWQPLKYPHMLISGATGGGKALDCSTRIATPTGWTTMGELRAGDQVFDETGSVCEVLQAHPVMYDRPCFEVVFSDGASIVADADHLWLTETRSSRISRSRAQKNEPEQNRQRRMSTTQVARLPALRTRGSLTLQEIADVEGRPAPSTVLRRVARQVGSDGRTQHLTTWLRGSKMMLRRSRQIATFPAASTVDAYLAATTERLHDQRDERSLPAVRTTAELASTLRAGGYINHSIPAAASLQLPAADLPIAPYVLGCWLGDGDSAVGRITSVDIEVIQNIRDAGYAVGEGLPDRRRPSVRSYTVPTLTGQLRALGLLHNKHVPAGYLRGSVEQREALLAGLLDTDGTVAPAGKSQFDSTVHELALGVQELALSLGHRATITSRQGMLEGRACKQVWRVSFTTRTPVFRLNRKATAQQRRTARHQPARTGQRYIVDVRAVPTRPVRCLTVNSASKLYLAGDHMIPTHNTAMIRTVLVMALLQGWRVTLLDPKQTSFQAFADWPGVERLCITGGDMREALFDHKTEMQKVYDGLRTGHLTHDQIVPNLLIFDEVTEGFADIAEWVEENFEDIQNGDTQIKLPREIKRAPDATWRVTRKGRESRNWQLLGLQRPDTRFIPGEARDNLITRVAAGQMRGDGLEMMFEDASVKQRVTERIVDPATGEALDQHVPGRVTIDVGNGPEPMQSLWTPDPARASGDEVALLNQLREAVADAQIARLRRTSFNGAEGSPEVEPPPASSSAQLPSTRVAQPQPVNATDRTQQTEARDLQPGQWILLATDADEEPAEVVELDLDEDNNSAVIEYRRPDGSEGSYELEADALIELGEDPS